MKLINEYWLKINNEEMIELSSRESKVIKVILEDKFISYNKLCNILYSCDFDKSHTSAMTLFISRLNKKISKYMKLNNRRKIGYYVKE